MKTLLITLFSLLLTTQANAVEPRELNEIGLCVEANTAQGYARNKAVTDCTDSLRKQEGHADWAAYSVDTQDKGLFCYHREQLLSHAKNISGFESLIWAYNEFNQQKYAEQCDQPKTQVKPVPYMVAILTLLED